MSDADRWIASHLKPEVPRLLFGTSALVVVSFVNFRTGAQLRNAIEAAPGAGRAAIARSLLLFGVGAAAGSIRTFIFDSTAERLRASLAAEVFAARLRAEPTLAGSTGGEDAGSTSSAAMEGDVAICAESLPKLQNTLRYMASVLGGTFAMFRASWKLSAAVWPLLVVGALRGARAGAKQAGKSAKQLATAREDAATFAEERLQHADLVRWFSRAGAEAAAFREKCGTCVTVATRAARGRSVAHLVLDFSAKGVLLGLCSLGSRLVHRGELTAGELTAFFFHASFLGLGLYGLVGLAPELAVAHEAADRLAAAAGPREVADTKAEIVEALPPASPCEPLAVRFQDVRFAYSGKCILDGFTLDIPAGTSCALVGPSGCGKSTVIRLLLRDFDVLGGSIHVGGRDAAAMSRDALRRQLGVAPQQAALLGGSVAEAIAFGEQAPLPDVEAAARQACAHDFVSAREAGYAAPVGPGGKLLSGGERQRLATARALLRRAPVLVLDEPTSALDTATAAAFTATLLAPGKRPTTLVVTHSLSVIRCCDAVAVLSESGRVEQHGTFASLIADSSGRLAQIMKAGQLEDDVAT